MLVEVIGLETRHCDIQVRLDDGCDITLVHTEVESLDVVIVGHDAVDFGLDEDVGDDRRQVVRRNLFIKVERVGLLDNLHDLLQLLKLAKWRLLFLQAAGFFDRHFPGMPHRIVDDDTEGTGGQLL